MKSPKYIAMALALSASAAMAQQTTTPYSMYGFGILSDRATSMQRQMGYTGYAMNSGRQINVMNPASYAAIDSLTFLFDMGATVSCLWQKETIDGIPAKDRSTGGGLDYITMQFPLSKFMGASIGLIPYSSVGYAFGKEVAHGALQTQGSGGINQAYVGVAGKIKGFSLGANVAYSFGNNLNDHFTYPTTGGTTLIEHVMQIRDWDIWLGAQYTAKLHGGNRFVAGATYAPKKSMHGKTWVTAQETTADAEAVKLAEIDMKGNYGTPTSLGFGLSFTHDRKSKWSVEADVTYQQWSKVKYAPLYATKDPTDLVFQGMKFNDRKRYSIGGEYIPKQRGNFLQQTTYRLGAYFNDDYLNIRSNGTDNALREYGVTAGFGFPVPEGKTMINLGVEWKRRKAHPNPLITENYLNICLGVNFNELWFWQRKIK